jgi:hypothetical protein
MDDNEDFTIGCNGDIERNNSPLIQRRCYFIVALVLLINSFGVQYFLCYSPLLFSCFVFVCTVFIVELLNFVYSVIRCLLNYN